jgi:hypothetical protein
VFPRIACPISGQPCHYFPKLKPGSLFRGDFHSSPVMATSLDRVLCQDTNTVDPRTVRESGTCKTHPPAYQVSGSRPSGYVIPLYEKGVAPTANKMVSMRGRYGIRTQYVSARTSVRGMLHAARAARAVWCGAAPVFPGVLPRGRQ